MKKRLMKIPILAIFVGTVILFTHNSIVVSKANLNNEHLTTISDISMLDEIETGTIYFGSDFHQTCVLFKPLLEDVCSTNDLSILYFDIGYLLDNKIADDATIAAILDEYKIEGIPTLVNVKNFEVDSMTTFGLVSDANSVSLTRQIEEFLYADSIKPQGFLTQNNIELLIVGLFILTIISSLIYFIYTRKKAKCTYLSFAFHLASICGIFALRRSLIDGADMYHWSLNITYSIILFITFLMDLLVIILSIMARKRSLFLK